MKLLFLDMDGVLNSRQSSHYYWKMKNNRKAFMNGFDDLCHIACSNLDSLLEEFKDIQVVISSTWRKFHDISTFNDEMKNICPSIVGRIIGETPDIGGPRGHEIYKWLEDNNHLNTPFIVLDDDSDMEKVEESFLWVDGRVGFSWINLEKAKMMYRLKEPKT